jgi:hypothetical protein
LNVGVLPQADHLFSSRELAKLVIMRSSSASDVAEYKLPRSWNYGLNYYFGRELREWTPGSPQPDWIVTTPQAALEIQNDGIQISEINSTSAPAIMLLRVRQPEEKRSLR